MVRISILYPNSEGTRFDSANTSSRRNMPDVHPGLLSAPQKRISAGYQSAGLGAQTPRTRPTFIAMCHFLFRSVEDFLAAFKPHAEVPPGWGDMPNFRNHTSPSFSFKRGAHSLNRARWRFLGCRTRPYLC
jgi:hypothetical protein